MILDILNPVRALRYSPHPITSLRFHSMTPCPSHLQGSEQYPPCRSQTPIYVSASLTSPLLHHKVWKISFKHTSNSIAPLLKPFHWVPVISKIQCHHLQTLAFKAQTSAPVPHSGSLLCIFSGIFLFLEHIKFIPPQDICTCCSFTWLSLPLYFHTLCFSLSFRSELGWSHLGQALPAQAI